MSEEDYQQRLAEFEAFWRRIFWGVGAVFVAVIGFGIWGILL